MEQDLRRAQGGLTFCGVGIALFGMWGFVKAVLYNLFAASYVHDLLGKANISPELEWLIQAIWIISAFFGALLDVYVGTRAIREGRGGGKRNSVYLLIAGVLLVRNVFTPVQHLLLFSGSVTEALDLAGETTMELVQAVNLGILIFYAGRVRRLSRNAGREEHHAD